MNSIYEAELNLEWWNSKSPAYQKRYLQKHPNSIYADKAKSGELEVKDSTEKKSVDPLDKIAKQRDKTNERISTWDKEKDKAWEKYTQVNNQLKDMPMIWMISEYGTNERRYSFDNKTRDGRPYNPDKEFTQDELEKLYQQIEHLKNERIGAYAEYENAKHNMEVAIRYKKRLQLRENFERRLMGPDTTTKYKESGVAEYVDFSGMSHEAENEVMEQLTKTVDRYPFMKNHLTFVGSHKSKKFKELSWQLAHDYYYDEVEKQYNENKDYIRLHTKGYHGKETNPDKMIEDKSNWDSIDAWENAKYYNYNLGVKWRLIDAVDRRGGIENYIKTPTYQNAIKRWTRMSSRTWAFYRSDSLKDGKKGMISFNENQFDESNQKHNVETKWHPEGCDTKKSVMDHEFGHAIWYQLGLNKKFKKNERYDWEELSPLQKYIKNKMYMGKEFVKNNLSQYASTNPSEFFAEAFSEYLNNPHPRKIASEVGKLLEEEIKQRGLK
jgi:hypothetical protein